MTATVRSELMDLRQAASLALWAAIEQTLTGWGVGDAARAARSARHANHVAHEQACLAARTVVEARAMADVLGVADLLAAVAEGADRLAARPTIGMASPRPLHSSRPDSTPIAPRVALLRASAAAEPNVADALLGAALAVETAVAPLPVAHAGVTAGLIATARAAAERVVLDAAGHSLLAAARIVSVVDELAHLAERLARLVPRTPLVADAFATLPSQTIVTVHPFSASALRVGGQWMPAGTVIDAEAADAWLVDVPAPSAGAARD